MVNDSIYTIAYALLGCSSINTVNVSAMAKTLQFARGFIY